MSKYHCDTCGKSYSNKRNLSRHVKEKHGQNRLFFKCIFNDCKSKFVRRSYVTKHLMKIHNMDKQRAKQEVQDLVLNVEVEDVVKHRTPLNEACYYSDISDDDLEFDQWLDNIVVREPATDNIEQQQIDDDSATTSQPSATPSPFEEPELLHIYQQAEASSSPQQCLDVVTSDAPIPNERMDNESSQDANGSEETIEEYINLTLKFSTTFRDNCVTKCERTASVAYSDRFHPCNANATDIFSHVQQMISEYMAQCN